MTAENFREKIEEQFEDLYGFEDCLKEEEKEFLDSIDMEFVENNDETLYDSYGNEDSTLERVYLHKPTNKYFMICGTRQSYNGTEWDEIKEVKRT